MDQGGVLLPVRLLRINEPVLSKTQATGGEAQTFHFRGYLRLGYLKLLLFCIALGLGLMYLWCGWAVVHDMDSISYLDMGDAFWRGNFKTAVNGVWSPLYPLLVGGALKIAKPSAAWEFPIVHIVGFVIYVGALFCFQFLWAEFRQLLRERSISKPGNWETLPDWVWWLLGYCLFLWVSLQLVQVLEETPDMLVAAIVYLSTGLLLRIHGNHARMGTFFLLGLALGLGYLTKAILFPLSFVFLAVAAVTTFRRRQSAARPLVALLVFLLTASPLLFSLSRAKGRFTFGDSGRINYIWHVDGVPRTYWQGEYPGSGAPIHPPRLILPKPAIYEFTAPFTVTFSPWYDPSYWYEGMNPHFDRKKQIRALIEAAGIYHGLFGTSGALLVAVSLMLVAFGGSMKDHAGALSVLLPAVVALGLYALVHVEPRYVGPFILVLCGGLLCQVRVPDGQLASRLLLFSTLAIVIFYSTALCRGTFAVARGEKDLASKMQDGVQVAQTVRQAGLKEGDPVGLIGGISGMVWARMAKVRIVANLPDDADFWSQGPDTRSTALSAFATTGAKAVVAQMVPPSAPTDGWLRIGHTRYYLYPLVPSADHKMVPSNNGK